MAIPILGRYRERRQAELSAAIEASVEKALLPSIAAAQGVSGATNMPNMSSPFNQTAGMVPGYQPLPRPADNFNSGFGPGFPFTPDAIDAIGPGGRVMPRRSQYLVSANLQLGTDRRVPWTNLKWLAEECDIVARCINLVQDGLLGREWSWGFSDSVIETIMEETGEANHARAMALAKEKYGEELNRVKEFFAYPDQRSHHNFSQFLSEAIYMCLTYDGVVIYPQRNLGGELISLSGIDTSTIKILLDNQGFPPQPPAPAYQQILYGFPRSEFQASGTDDFDIDGEFSNDQLAYYIRRPRPGSVYGYPPTEEVMTVATTYLARQAWMAAEYSYGSMPRTFFEMSEMSSWTPEQVSYFEQVLNDRLAGQIQRRQMGFLLPNGMKPTFSPQLDEKYKNDYDAFLIGQIASKFGVPQSQLGIQAKAGLSGGKQMEGESDQTEHFTTASLINFFIDILNDLARRFMGVGPEITATCQDPGSSEADKVQQANADKTVVSFGGLTLNDYRAKNGLPLYDAPEADEPMIVTATGPVYLKGTLAVQDANTENTLNPPEPPKQVMVGPDGQPLPEQNGGNDGAGNDGANGGLQSVPSGAGAGQAKPSGGAGPSASSGTSDQSDKTDADGGTKVGGPSVGSKPAVSQDSSATKELAAFVKFAKSRSGRSYRQFEFTTLGEREASWLNALARDERLDEIQSFVKGDAIQANPVAAGIAVKAADTGRILLVQRSIDNQNEQAAGKWEIPGGKLDGNDTAYEAACREWSEEIGVDLPDGKVVGSWTTPNGRYICFVYVIAHETDVELSDTRSSMDNTGDSEIENVAWWTINDMQGNPAIRAEVESADWALLGHAKKASAHESGPTDSKWALHPVHKYHDAIVEFYVDKLAQALKDGTHGIHEAIVAAQRKAADRKNDNSAKSLAKDANSDAYDAVAQHVTMSPGDASKILQQMMGDGYLAGSHIGAVQTGGKVLQGLSTADHSINWDEWKPGWGQAAGTVRDGGLADLLSQSMATIQGIQGTAMTRLGNVLADGIAAGDSVDTIASSMSDLIMSPDRAYLISNTETAAAMTQASLSTYEINGVAQWEWIAEDDACPECLDAESNSPYDVTDSGADTIPLHPACRCASSPIVDLSDVQQTLDLGDDTSDESDN